MVEEIKVWSNIELSNLRNLYNVLPIDLVNIVLNRFTPMEITRKAIELGLTTPDSLKLSEMDVERIVSAYKSCDSIYLFFNTLKKFTSRQILNYLVTNSPNNVVTDFSYFLNDYTKPPFELMRSFLEDEALMSAPNLVSSDTVNKELEDTIIATKGAIDFNVLEETEDFSSFMNILRVYYKVMKENDFGNKPAWEAYPGEYEALTKAIDYVFSDEIKNPVIAEFTEKAKEEVKQAKEAAKAERKPKVAKPKENTEANTKKDSSKVSKARTPKSSKPKPKSDKIDIFMPVKRWEYEELDIIVSYSSFMRSSDLETLLPRWSIREIEEKWEQLKCMGITSKEALDLYLE